MAFRVDVKYGGGTPRVYWIMGMLNNKKKVLSQEIIGL